MDSSVPNPFLIDELDANSQPQTHPTHVQPQQQIIAGDTHGGISSCCTVTSTTTTTTTAHRPGPPMRPPPPHGVAQQGTPMSVVHQKQPPKSAFDDLNNSIRFALEGSPSKQANVTMDSQMASNVGFGGVAASVGGSQHPAPQQQTYSSTSSSTSQPLVGGP